MSREQYEPTTTRKTMGQIVVCLGCCCGRTDKGHPEVPVDWLKSEWRKRQLPKKIHLTISGCLGPCDATNIVMVLLGNEAIWLGGINSQDHYRELADWASACDRHGELQPLPPSLLSHRLVRFVENSSNSQRLTEGKS